ncbi:MAG: DegT/DnrJ/EryC1/StrS family aminotransferase [Chloroflexi bacterium]|nr:DegT/DnrJ/EryC1/StrS family aminotransferase [Chloroflexota bacterium]
METAAAKVSWKIPLFKIYWDEDDIEAVNQTIRAGMYWSCGPQIAEFEQGLSHYLGTKFCAVFSSGTTALHAVLWAHGIGPGDEVIVPSFTFISTANAALFVGARPVFADIEDSTFGLDPEDVERRITPRTKAILPVHYAGGSCLIRELREVADRHHLLLIEDAAESFGATVDGKAAGAFGQSAILSFCQNKIIATGEGGAVVTESKEIYEKLKLLRSHGRLESADYFSSTDYLDYVTLGHNFRLSTFCAALGLAQLRKANRLIEMRRNNARLLDQRLVGIPGVGVITPPPGYHHVYQMYSIVVPGGRRDGLMQHLAERGIMSKVFFHPLHKTHFYKAELKYDCSLPVTERVSQEILTLPMYPAMSEEEIDLISKHIRGFFSGAR